MAPPSHQGTTEALPVHTRTASASVADDTRVLVRADALKRSGIPTGAHVLLRSTHAPTPLWAGTVWPDFDPQAPGVSVPSLSADPLGRDVVVACVREAPTVPRLTVALDAAPTPLLHALLMHTLVDMGAVALHRAWRITLLGHAYEARPLRPSNVTSDVVLVTRDTHLTLEETTQAAPLVDASAYHALGGLDTQIAAIRTLIELPLTQPQLFAQYGLTPPRLSLIHI